MTMKIKFTKMHGAGNDFLIIDDRSHNFPENDVELVRAISARGTGVGCEGVLIVRLAAAFTDCDYEMIFLNPDGSRASMCGNASRCVALYTFERNIAGRRQRVGADAGVITLDVLEAHGIAYVGGARGGHPPQGLVVERNGIRLGFLGYTSGMFRSPPGVWGGVPLRSRR